MTSPLAPLVTLVALAVAAVGTGQLLSRAIGLRRLERLDVHALAASAILGAATWTVGFSLLSSLARLPARGALAVLAALHAPLLMAAWRRGAAGIPKLRGPAVDWLALGGSLAVTATLALLPVLRYQGFAAGNDTHTYCALAEWLQQHGTGDPVSQPGRSPSEGIAALYQRRGYPLGAAYPLALARAAGVAPVTLAIYPAVSALGLILAVCGLWWMSRRALRLDRCVVSTTVLVYALAPHAAYWAHHNGFLSQTLGVSGLLLGLAALASAGGISRRTGLVTFSLAAAFLYVVYLPFLILLGAAAAVHAVAEAARVRRDKRLSVALRGWTWALVLPLALVGLDLTPLIRGLPNLLGSGAVGGHIPLDVAGFAAVALGPGPGAWAGWPRWTVPGTGLLALAAALLATKGTRALGRGRRGLGVLTVAAVLAGLLLVCGGFSRDPWTGQRGQTWFIFKTVQWLFPVALLLEAAGLSSIRRHRKGVAMVMLTAAASLVPAHLPWSRALATAMKDILGGNRPLAELPDVLRHFRELPEGRLVLLGLPERVSDFRGHYAALLSWPRPLAVDWEGNASLRVLKRIDAQDVIALLAEAPPFDREDRVDLGARFARLTALERPRLVQLVARLPAVGVAHTEGLVVPLARSRTKLLVLAPRGGPVELELRFEPSAGARTSVVRCQIIPGAAGGPSYRRVVRLTPPRLLRVVRGVANVVRFDAEPGLNAVVLVPDGAPQRLLNVAVREGSTTTKPPVP